MKNNVFRKGIVSGFLILLIVTSALPGILGEIGHNSGDFYKSDGKIRSLFAIDWWPMYHHDLNHSGYSTANSPNTNIVTWSYTTGDWVYSSPAVSNGRVFVGSDDGKVYCLNADNGSEIWNYTTGDWVYSSPTVCDGKLFIGSWDGNMYCLDIDDGSKIWNYTTEGSVFSSPAVYYGKVFVGSDDGKVYCLNADDGTEIWNYSTGGWVWSSPAVSDGNVYFGSGDYKLYCLSAEYGTEIWYYDTGNWVDSSPAVADGKIYIGSFDGNIYCLNTFNGKEIWRYATEGSIDSSPAVSNGKLYIGSFDGKIYCLNTSNGYEIWNYSTGGNVRSSPAVCDGRLYIGSMDYKVYCFGDEIINNRPNAPSIDGPNNGTIGTSYNYTFNSVDPDGDAVYYYILWGDSHVEVWDGPHTSGTDFEITHTYKYKGTYTIEAKARDSKGAESNWKTMTVTMPKSKTINMQFLRFFENHPNLFQIFQKIIQKVGLQ